MSEISRIHHKEAIHQVKHKATPKKATVKKEEATVVSDQVTLSGPKTQSTEKVVMVDKSKSKWAPKGFDENFLGEDAKVPLPKLTGKALEEVLDIDGKGDHVREYNHFSLVMNKDRRLAAYTAHNIDGGQMRHDIRRSDWKVDDQIGYKNQYDNYLYHHNPIDRGHLVRRLAVAWGNKGEAKMANDDTFYYTNASPQHKDLNQKTWHDLENWLLDKTDDQDRKAAVFTGPVFRDDDVEYRGAKIPADFWKIVVVKREKDGEVAACGFMMSQKNLIQNLGKHRGGTDNDYRGDDRNKVHTSEISPFQVELSTIEDLTGLDFGKLKEVDPYSLYKSRMKKAPAMEAFTFEGKKITTTPPDQTKHYIKSPEDIIM